MFYFVYILTNKSNTLYIGSTDDLVRRVKQHTTKQSKSSFTAKYNINKLVYYEKFDTLSEAVSMERKIKGWTRKRKIELIKSMNPNFEDLLSSEILQPKASG